MAIDKVLNRPMFRKAALQKGHLKPIKANVGIMVGQPYSSPNVPAVVPGQGTYSPVNTQRFGPPKPTRFQNFMRNPIVRSLRPRNVIPFELGYMGTGKVLDYADPNKELGGITRFGLQTLGGLGAMKIPGVSALASGPGIIALGSAYGLKNRYDAGKKELARIKAMSPAEYEEFKRMNEIKALEGEAGGFTDEELFGKFVPKEKLPSVEPKTTLEKRKRARGVRPETESVTDKLVAEDNRATIDNQLVDIDKVVKNQRPRMDEIAGGGPTEPQKPQQIKTTTVTEQEDEKKTDQQANANVVTAGAKTDLNKPGKITAADGTQVTDSVIERAKQIRKELMAGKSSQAKLVFLANLASGLLTGTTTKGGIGGAIEVFGKSIGPAVNNYAAIKLKENELENEFMSDALELAQDEFEARNAILEAPDFPDATAGIIQFSDERGNVRNMSARQLKDGTIQIAVPGQTDQYGRQLFQTAPVGTFDRFVDAKYATKEQGETLRNLSGKYKAYNLGRKTIDILREAEGADKKFAGPAAVSYTHLTLPTIYSV